MSVMFAIYKEELGKDLTSTYRVRTMSNGASTKPASPAATTATPRDPSGEGLSIMSSPPTPPLELAKIPGSGKLRRAENMLRVPVSIVLRSTL